MNGKDLFLGMSFLEQRLVEEAEGESIPKRRASPWLKAGALAACVCLTALSLYHLKQVIPPGVTEGLPRETIAEIALPEGSCKPGNQEGMAMGEVPSVILLVEEMTDSGFTGTVAKLTDTDILKIGTKLNVVVLEETGYLSANGHNALWKDSKTNLAGTYVVVQFIEYDRINNTIKINMIQETEQP